MSNHKSVPSIGVKSYFYIYWTFEIVLEILALSNLYLHRSLEKEIFLSTNCLTLCDRFGYHIKRIPMSSFEISDSEVKGSVATTVHQWNKGFKTIRRLGRGEDWSTFFRVKIVASVFFFSIKKGENNCFLSCSNSVYCEFLFIYLFIFWICDVFVNIICLLRMHVLCVVWIYFLVWKSEFQVSIFQVACGTPFCFCVESFVETQGIFSFMWHLLTNAGCSSSLPCEVDLARA